MGATVDTLNEVIAELKEHGHTQAYRFLQQRYPSLLGTPTFLGMYPGQQFTTRVEGHEQQYTVEVPDEGDKFYIVGDPQKAYLAKEDIDRSLIIRREPPFMAKRLVDSAGRTGLSVADLTELLKQVEYRYGPGNETQRSALQTARAMLSGENTDQVIKLLEAYKARANADAKRVLINKLEKRGVRVSSIHALSTEKLEAMLKVIEP